MNPGLVLCPTGWGRYGAAGQGVGRRFLPLLLLGLCAWPGACRLDAGRRWAVDAGFPEKVVQVIEARAIAAGDQEAVAASLVYALLIRDCSERWALREGHAVEDACSYLTLDEGRPAPLTLEILREAGYKVEAGRGHGSDAQAPGRTWIGLTGMRSVSPGVWEVTWCCDGTTGGWVGVGLVEGAWRVVEWGPVWNG